MKSKTYDEWTLLGYHVMKGEKATGRNALNKATFTRDQVEEFEDDYDLYGYGPDDDSGDRD